MKERLVIMKYAFLKSSLIMGAMGLTATTPLEAGSIQHTMPAVAGHSWLPSEASCFTNGSFSNAVQNTGCSGIRTWFVPVPLQVAFTETNLEFRATSNGTGTAVTCRYVLRSQNDAHISLGSSTTIGSDTVIGAPTTIGAFNTAHYDCSLTQNGKRLTSVHWFDGP
jgi:hypothetical protein